MGDVRTWEWMPDSPVEGYLEFVTGGHRVKQLNLAGVAKPARAKQRWIVPGVAPTEIETDTSDEEFPKGAQHVRPESKDDVRKHVHRVIKPQDLKPDVTMANPDDLTDTLIAVNGVIGGVVSHQVQYGGPHGPKYNYLVLFEDGDRLLALSKDPLVQGAGKDRPVAPITNPWGWMDKFSIDIKDVLEKLPVTNGKVDVDESDFGHLMMSDMREACMATGCDSYGMNRDDCIARFVKWIRELKPAEVDLDSLDPGGVIDRLITSSHVSVPAADGYLLSCDNRRHSSAASSSRQ